MTPFFFIFVPFTLLAKLAPIFAVLFALFVISWIFAGIGQLLGLIGNLIAIGWYCLRGRRRRPSAPPVAAAPATAPKLSPLAREYFPHKA